MSFSEAVREELAHGEQEPEGVARAELAAVLRFGGAFTVGGGTAGVGYILQTATGAVARRVKTALRAQGAEVRVEVHRPQGLRSRTSYRLVLEPPAARVLAVVGLLDAEGRPVDDVVGPPGSDEGTASVRGAFLAAGSVSDPRAAPHLEVRAPSEPCAAAVAAVLRPWEVPASVGEHGDGWRVTVKSAAAIGTVLARLGAHSAYLRWDAERLRRELRTAANRVANADRANAARVVRAAAPQVRRIEAGLSSTRWDELPEDLREVGLARLANPDLSLAELGRLLDPPVGKATVHRRLERLLAALRGLEQGGLV